MCIKIDYSYLSFESFVLRIFRFRVFFFFGNIVLVFSVGHTSKKTTFKKMEYVK